jgi:hypothetical protein
MTDSTKHCRCCGEDFVWPAGEQRLYSTVWLSAPSHFPACRALRKTERAAHGRSMPDPDSASYSVDWIADLHARTAESKK